MTSVAFIMGVVPLVFSSGAGAEIGSAMGVAVFAGMLGVTVFGLFLTPVFYTVIGASLAARGARGHAIGGPLRAGSSGGPLMHAYAELRSSDPVALGQCGVRLRAGLQSPEVPAGGDPARRPCALRGAALRSGVVGEFEDPVLDALITPALDANLDVRVAVAGVEQARAVFDERRSTGSRRVTVGAERRSARAGGPGLSRRAGATPPPIAPASTRSGRSTCSAGCARRCGPRRPTPRASRRRSTTCG